MEILAKSGQAYLLVEDGITELESDTQARVLNDRYNKLYPWQLGHSIVARGYWEEYDASDGELDAMLDNAETVTY